MTGKEQIQSLIAHGVRLGTVGDLTNSVPIPDGFLSYAIGLLKQNKAQAVTYNLVLPGSNEQMAIRVCIDGHVDIGALEDIKALERGMSMRWPGTMYYEIARGWAESFLMRDDSEREVAYTDTGLVYLGEGYSKEDWPAVRDFADQYDCKIFQW